MLGERQAAEDVVQEGFAGLYRRWEKLSDPGNALPYVRSSVLNGCRTQLRRHAAARPAPPGPAEHLPGLVAAIVQARDRGLGPRHATLGG
jgi:DNA-directed RNA polymerase specialized sigma24 family protein